MAYTPYVNCHLLNDSRFKKRPKGTWERKPEVEVKKIKEQLKRSSLSPKFPIGVFIIVLFSFTIMADHPNALMILILFPTLSFIATYAFQIKKGRSLIRSPRFKVCNNCYKEDLIGRKECGCGGEFEPPDFFNFIEEVEDPQDLQATPKK